MWRNLLIVLLGLTTVQVQGWYTCRDKPFCDKIRHQTNPQNHFDLDDVSGNGQLVTGILTNTATNQALDFDLHVLAGGMFRVIVDDPANRRHRMEDALDGNPASNTGTVTITAAEVRIVNGDASLIIQRSPFKIDVYEKTKLIQVINGRGRMEFVSDPEDHAIAMDIKYLGAQRAYGIPQHAERLALIDTTESDEPYRMFNVDYCCYKVESREPLYGAVPVLYGHGTQGSSGLFWLTSSQTFVDIQHEEDGVNALLISQSGVIDMFILTGPTLPDAVKQYASLTGTAPLPPLFSIAYHQSRYSYMTQDDLETVVSEFDRNDFPLDVMWLDIDYTDNKKYFTWNLTAFPDPVGMQEKLNSTGRKLVTILDPHIKVETGYFVYDQAKAGGWFVKNPDGSDYEGICWPGLSSYIDFTNPDALEWYADLNVNFPLTTDIVHIWNDMNEPSVFEVDEQTMTDDQLHYDGWKHKDVHNVFGFYQTKGTYQGMLKRFDNTRRSFILTRSHFAGSQRYTALWTGDNMANWDHMRFSIPMCLTEALAGISFCGADVGGFMENPDDELYQRWYQLGAWIPFFRAHSTINSNRREPYLYPADIQTRVRRAMRQRYQHLPYWYTVWFEHTQSGDPVMRPLSYNYPNDLQALDNDWQFLIGTDILVSPVLDPGVTERMSYFPGQISQEWYDIDNNLMYRRGYYTYPVTIDSMPVFYRGGSIVARKDTIRSTSELTHNDPYTLYIFLDSNSQASGRVYIDDYKSFDYVNKRYLYIEFTFVNEQLDWKNVHEDADFDSSWYVAEARIYRPPSLKSGATVRSGKMVRNSKVSYSPDGFYMNVTNINVDFTKEGNVKLF